ncbi:MAG: DUF4129 domain-containing protein [Thermonemataceae bacterium]
MRVKFILLLWLFISTLASAQSDSIVVVRHFNESELSDYKSDSDYNYDREKAKRSFTWWDKFKRWFADKFFKSLFGESDASERWILYLLLAIVIIYVILRFLKADLSSLLSTRKNKQQELTYEDVSSNIQQVDFDLLIQKAIKDRQFDLSVRFMYLKSLRLLSDKNLIDWQPDKTNIEYLYDLNVKPTLQDKFRSISLFFDYTFYGDFDLSEDLFYKLKPTFDNFYTSVNELNA